MAQDVEEVLVQEFIAHPAIEGLNEPVSRIGLPGAMQCHSTLRSSCYFIRAHLGEFGVAVARGIHNVDRLLEAARDVPTAAIPALDILAGQLRDTQARIGGYCADRQDAAPR